MWQGLCQPQGRGQALRQGWDSVQGQEGRIFLGAGRFCNEAGHGLSRPPAPAAVREGTEPGASGGQQPMRAPREAVGALPGTGWWAQRG